MRRALVVSGGGQRGSFAVGAVKYLMQERGLDFDLYAGTSTGSLVTTLLAADGKSALARLEAEYTTVRTSDIITDRWKDPLHWFPISSLYLSTPLRHRVEKGVPKDVLDRIAARGTQLFLTTVNLISGHIVYFHSGAAPARSNGDFVALKDHAMVVDAMVASSSIPFSMPPVEMSLDGGKTTAAMVDGGVRQYAPIKVCIDAGAEEIWCLVLMPPPEVRAVHTGDFKSIATVAETTVDMLSQEVADGDVDLSTLYTGAMDYIDAVKARLLAALPDAGETVERAFADTPENPFVGKKAVRLNVIRPAKLLEGDTLSFDPTQMKHNLEYGYQRAADFFEP